VRSAAFLLPLVRVGAVSVRVDDQPPSPPIPGPETVTAVQRDEALKFRERFLRRILDAQGKDGTFTCACAHGSFGTTCDTDALPGGMAQPGEGQDSRMYVTALHTLILALDRVPSKALPPAKKPAAAPTVTPR
jgi:hypothetical protein